MATTPGKRPIKQKANLQNVHADESAPPAKTLRTLVLDPGFRSSTGHHLNNNLSLTAAAKAQGFEFKLLAGDTCRPPASLAGMTSAHFATDLYGGANVFQESWEFDSWLHVNASFKADLERIPAQTLEWTDLILVPAVTQFHMLALAQWLARTLAERPALKAIVQLMFSPTWTAWDAVCDSGPQMYADAFEILEPFRGEQLFYCSELPASCLEFEPLVGAPVPVLPHPGIWPSIDMTPPKRASSGPVRVGFFGYAKREKGFHLLPHVLRATRERFTPQEVEFFIQINHGGHDGAIGAAEQELLILAGPGVELRTGAMSDSEYARRFSESDILLLPYDPALYRGRGSGVFSEAIGFGKVIVAPSEAGVGEEIRKGVGAGILFEEHTGASVAAATAKAIASLPQLSRIAADSAPTWRNHHSGQGFLRTLRELVA